MKNGGEEDLIQETTWHPVIAAIVSTKQKFYIGADLELMS
jgi:hypothetical protein